MDSERLSEAIARVKKMEECFDTLLQMAKKDPASVDKEQLTILVDYYESSLWMEDYQLDEQGLLPQNLKRGVLSEDGVFDLLTLLSDVDQHNHK